MSGLDSFPVVVDVPVRWGDMDAYGHVNNSVYLTYFEDARIAYFKALGLPGWVTRGGPGDVGPIVHSTRCRYRIPVTYPDTLRVGVRVDVAGMGADRFNMILTAWSEKHGAAAADGECLVVVYDYGAGKKASVTPELRAAIARVERSSIEGAAT